jgi:molybdate transport system ATP-binding protein
MGGMASEMIVDIEKRVSPRFMLQAKFHMAVESPHVLILFGPSGSGKTTLLRCLAGLERPDRGSIRFGPDAWFDYARDSWISPQKRQIGFMFQDYALFPIYTVADNIAYGLEDLNAGARAQRVAEILGLFDLTELQDRRPAQLSGGQQQRVALARAVARSPRLILLDEPLSALDAPIRSKLRGELRALLRRLAIPSIVVTHDWDEALTLGDQMAVIHAGQVLQMGSPQEVFTHPANAAVARIVGIETIVQGKVLKIQNGLATVDVDGMALHALSDNETNAETVGDVFVCIRAEDVILEPIGIGATSARNRLTGTILSVTPIGALVRVEIDCGFVLAAIVTRSASEELHLTPSGRVVAAIKAGAVHLVPHLVRSSTV